MTSTFIFQIRFSKRTKILIVHLIFYYICNMFRRCQFILLAAVLVFTGCSKKAAIPPNKMALILHDMYVLDAQIENDGGYSVMADTISV